MSRPVKVYGRLSRRPDGAWRIEAEPHVLILLRRCFPQMRRVARDIRLSDTAQHARDLEWFLSRYPLRMTSKDRDYLAAQAHEHRETETIVAKLNAGRRKPRAFKLALPPRDYQRVAADMCLRLGGLLVADELGLGKTLVGICVASVPAARPALVVTLTALPEQWQREFARFAPGLRTHVLKKGTPYDLRDACGATPDIVITSYSKLAGWADTLKEVCRSVVYDEVQELRRMQSQKYRAASVISSSVPMRLGLSATPIYNNGDEIFAVMDCLRPGQLGTRDEFLREWCTAMDSRGRARVKDPRALGTYLRDAGLMLRRTTVDVGRELPPLVKVAHWVQADASALEDAEDHASRLAEIILGKTATFHERGRASQELDARLRQATGIAKAPYVAAFVRMLVESGEKVVLFGWHREVYSIWLERLKDYRPAMYTGSESAAEKQASVDRFVAGDTPVLIMSLRSGAGLDGLQHVARILVFGELDWSPGVHDQCCGRLHRDDLESSVIAYYLVADEGSDPVVIDALGVKSMQAQGIADPNADVLERVANSGEHIRQLAEKYAARSACRAG